MHHNAQQEDKILADEVLSPIIRRPLLLSLSEYAESHCIEVWEWWKQERKR